MKLWVIYSLVSAFLWGLWGFFGKHASQSIPARNLLLLASLGNLLVFPVYVALSAKSFRFQWQSLSQYVALLGGVVGGIGSLFFYLALSKGEASRVVVITAAYPVLTVVLAFFFLQEPLSLQKGLGLALAMAGVYMLSV